LSARTSALVALAAAALAARVAEAVTVVSPGAAAVAVTVYRDDLALITETRTVDLPAEPVRLVFEDVVETLLPQSAVIGDAGRPLRESNFDFDRLTPKSLLERSIGETVTITRTNPATGAVTRSAAKVLAAGEGVVLETADGQEAVYCAGLPARIEFERLPAGLRAVPQLSVELAAGEAGPRTLRLSYLAHGFSWRADYVARLDETSKRMQLLGWATLANDTAARFRQAEVEVVAGTLNVLPASERGSGRADGFDDASGADADMTLLRRCYSTARRREPETLPQLMNRALAAPGALEEIVVTAVRVAAREALGDYQLYRIPWPTDLQARQSKQVALVTQPDVRVERLYGFRLAGITDTRGDDVLRPSVLIRFDNTARAGLGEPLPAGRVRVFEPYGGREVFAGEAEITDRPVGTSVELSIGLARGVTLTVASELDDDGLFEGRRVTATTEHRIVNSKAVPIDIEIRHGVEDWLSPRVRRASRPPGRVRGDLAWRFVVPPGAEETLRYELSAIPPLLRRPRGQDVALNGRPASTRARSPCMIRR
jgi:hypothetical protein